MNWRIANDVKKNELINFDDEIFHLIRILLMLLILFSMMKYKLAAVAAIVHSIDYVWSNQFFFAFKMIFFSLRKFYFWFEFNWMLIFINIFIFFWFLFMVHFLIKMCSLLVCVLYMFGCEFYKYGAILCPIGIYNIFVCVWDPFQSIHM